MLLSNFFDELVPGGHFCIVNNINLIMAKAWIDHVKATWKKNGGSYKDAMKAAKKTWKSKKASDKGGSMSRVAKAGKKKVRR